MTYLEYRHRIEFGQKEYDEIDNYCASIGITWTASAWDVESVDFLASYNVPFIKVPSALLTNKMVLKAIRFTDIPAILSTGMSTIEDIDNALEILDRVDCIMHCVSTYPSRAEEQNLNCIATLKERYPSIPIGFSNQFAGITYIPAAVALGAKCVEFHVTLDRSMWGTDQSASIEPEGVYKIMKYLKNVGVALGDGNKRIMEREIPIMQKLRG
jgi:N-acetylneuraminate synthase